MGLLIATIAALGAYLVAFYAWPFASLCQVGHSWHRWQFWALLLLPDELVRHWISDISTAAIMQRAVILTATGTIVGVSLLSGYVALRALKLDLALDRVERLVFAAGVGLNLVSLL